MSERVIGIDLGTTNSLVALVVDGRPRVLPNEFGELLTPSAVAMDRSGTLLVGAPAKERLSHAPSAGVAFFKREMGETTRFTVGREQLSAVELSSIVLRHLKESAEAHLGAPVHQAVISVPAYFQEPQRSATREAAAIAGLKVLRLINEPTAAAIAHGLDDTERERKAIVLDLGGGTFDVTILEVFHGVVEIIASGGDSRLGGEDFTDTLTAWVAKELDGPREVLLGSSDLSDELRAKLRVACDRAKCALSDSEVVPLDLPPQLLSNGLPANGWELRREDLESLCAPLIERVRRCIEETLVQAKLGASAIDEVVLVGGATRMPWMHKLAQTIFGRTPALGRDPDLAVALGAAVQASLAARDEGVRDLVVTDVTPHSLGVEIAREGGDRLMTGYFLPVLHRNTTLPARRVTRVSTLHSKQRFVRLKIYQGERRFAAHNRFLGSFEIGDIPPAESEEGSQPIDVCITCDINGLIDVEATIVATGKSASILIEQHPGRLNAEERASALAALQRLKTHPRDLLPNRHLLERARAAFETFDRKRRDYLDPYLFAFEAALERQDAEAVKLASDQLRKALSDLKVHHA